MDFFFPRRCPFCQKVTDGELLCRRCGDTLPFTGERAMVEGAFGVCASPLYYEEQVRQALLRLKFQARLGGLDCMGELLAQCAAEHFSGRFDTVTWVPVSRKRLRQRGFDQAFELCRSTCRLWGVEPVQTLHKVWDNPPQSGLTAAEERRANVLGVYEADAAQVCGRKILLLDDVLTTGATLSECARVLREAGAAEVVCLTLCRVR